MGADVAARVYGKSEIEFFSPAASPFAVVASSWMEPFSDNQEEEIDITSNRMCLLSLKTLRRGVSQLQLRHGLLRRLPRGLFHSSNATPQLKY